MCLDLLAAAGADPRTIHVNDATGEIRHGCLLTPGAHRDQLANPTASLNYKRLAGNCLGCKAAGGLEWFVAVLLRTDDAGARRWLTERGGGLDGVMSLPTLLAAITESFSRGPAAVEQMPVYSPAALDAFAHPHPYWTDAPAPPRTPGGGRGIAPATVARYRLGYDPATGRVVIPHHWRGQLVGWQTRAPHDTGDGPKYLNTPSFPRRTTLFNHNGDAEELLWFESAMSSLRHAHAMDDTAATFGAVVSDEQIAAMVRPRRLRRIVLWPDADPKGWDAVDGGAYPARGLIARLSVHVPVFVVDSPFTGDPGDLNTGLAEAVRNQFTIPAALWKRPEALLCWGCHTLEHPGPCPSQGSTP